MNRRTFVKYGITALFGIISSRLFPKSESVSTIATDSLATQQRNIYIRNGERSSTNKYGLASDEIDIREIIHGDIVEDDDATEVTTRFFYKGRRGITTTYISNNLLRYADFNLIEMLREVIFSDIRTGM